MGSEAPTDIVTELRRGNLNLAQIGGYSDEELAAAHDAAAIYLSRGQPAKSLRIAGLLMTLKPTEPRHYRIAGMAALHLGQSVLAESLLAMAALYGPQDVLTQLCLGEAKLENGASAEARTILSAAIAIAGPELANEARRARELLRRLEVSPT